MSEQCYILIFHGSATQEAKTTCSKFVGSLKNKSSAKFLACFLRGDSPNLSEALEQVYSDGFRNIICFPMLLLPGSHTMQEIPEQCQTFKAKHSDCLLNLLPCLSENNQFSDFIVSVLGNNCG